MNLHVWPLYQLCVQYDDMYSLWELPHMYSIWVENGKIKKAEVGNVITRQDGQRKIKVMIREGHN